MMVLSTIDPLLYMQLHRQPTALEAPAGKDSPDLTIADMIEDDSEVSPEDSAMQQLLHKDMDNLLYTLTQREGDVLRLRYGLDDGREKTLEEVGRILLVSAFYIACVATCWSWVTAIRAAAAVA